MSSSKTLAAHVHVRDGGGVVHVFGPGGTVPAWAAELITNPDAWATSTAPEAVEAVPVVPTAPQPPPRGGKGSGIAAWRAYAKAQGFEFEGDATREDIIDALTADGIPTE